MDDVGLVHVPEGADELDGVGARVVFWQRPVGAQDGECVDGAWLQHKAEDNVRFNDLDELDNVGVVQVLHRYNRREGETAAPANARRCLVLYDKVLTE